MEFKLSNSLFLLSDAKVLEDVFQDGSGAYLADYFGEVGDALAKVFGYEVAAKVGAQAADGALNVGMGLGESLLVALVGDEQSFAIYLGYGLRQLVFQPGQSLAVDGLEVVGLVEYFITVWPSSGSMEG